MAEFVFNLRLKYLFLNDYALLRNNTVQKRIQPDYFRNFET